MPIVLLVALLAIACSEDQELPPLPTGDDGEDGSGDTDMAVETSEPDAPRGDYEVVEDSGELSDVVGEQDVGSEVEPEVTEDVQETEVSQPPVQKKYECVVTAEDCYGMKYGMNIISDSVTVGENGFVGIMKFKATAGTDVSLEEERQTEAADSWLQEGATIPSFAWNLTGRYELDVSFSTQTLGTLICSNLDATEYEPQNASLFPMTWWNDEAGQPEPIGSYADNEVYVAVEPAVDMSIECSDAGCTSFAGTTVISDKWVKDAINAGCEDVSVPLTVECKTIEE